MPVPTLAILYVNDPAKSTGLYSRLLEREPSTKSPNFVVFDLGQGFKLGLLSRSTLEPAAPQGCNAELCFFVEDEAALDSLHQRWISQGAAVAFAPKRMYFGGYNSMVLDADGNRLRLSTPDRD